NCISRGALRDILLQGAKYLDWLPFHHTEKRVELYIAKRGQSGNCGRPFVELTDGDKSQLKTIVTIRNAIAHSSPHAANEFARTVIGSQPLLPREKTPAGYLRSQVAGSPIQTRFEAYIGTLGGIAETLLGVPLGS